MGTKHEESQRRLGDAPSETRTVTMSNPETSSELIVVAFVIDSQCYALPLGCVQRVLPMPAVAPLPDAPAIARGVINLHGTILPVIDLRIRLGLPLREHGIEGHLLIARAARRALALPVDEALGLRELPADSVAQPIDVLPGLHRVAGIASQPDGVLFIYDLDTLLSLDEEARLDEALRAREVP